MGELSISPQDSKSVLRKEVGARLRALTTTQRAAASAAAAVLLRKQTVWQQAQSILFYAPLSTELDVWPLFAEALEAGKTGALPRFCVDTGSYVACQVQDLERDVKPGHLGIREPIPNCRVLPLALDFILVPGVAFDLRCCRLGRGKGFYDQLLAVAHGTTCGVGFDEQIVPEVPVEPHDIRLSCILTPTRWVQR